MDRVNMSRIAVRGEILHYAGDVKLFMIVSVSGCRERRIKQGLFEQVRVPDWPVRGSLR